MQELDISTFDNWTLDNWTPDISSYDNWTFGQCSDASRSCLKRLKAQLSRSSVAKSSVVKSSVVFLSIFFANLFSTQKYIDGKLGNASQEKSQNKSQSLLKEKMCAKTWEMMKMLTWVFIFRNRNCCSTWWEISISNLGAWLWSPFRRLVPKSSWESNHHTQPSRLTLRWWSWQWDTWRRENVGHYFRQIHALLSHLRNAIFVFYTKVRDCLNC